jgi:hypothetical protein
MNEPTAPLTRQPSVLITGGSGLIGRYLTSLLLSEGYKVSHLSRSSGQFGRVRVYRWDPDQKYIDPEGIRGVNYIIHLSGANIGNGRWTRRRKQEIINSRVGTANLLHSVVKSAGQPLKAFISASAIGYYGASSTENIYTETDPPASDFLGQTCRDWENAADLFSMSNIRTVKIRTAVVLEKTDAALARFLSAARFGIFPTLGTGRQYMPWIHIADLCRVYLMALKDNAMSGAYNAAAPDHTDNRRFVRTLSEVMKRPFISPPVPGIILRLAMGESAVIALNGSRVSSQKLISQGFIFEFPDLENALADILKY